MAEAVISRKALRPGVGINGLPWYLIQCELQWGRLVDLAYYMGLRFPEFLRQPGLILPYLGSLFVTRLADYLFGLIGAISVASIFQVSFDLEFGPFIAEVLEIYRIVAAWIIDPLASAIIALVEWIAPGLKLDLSISEAWKDGVILLGIYYQKHARNEWAGGRRLSAAYQFLVGVVIAVAFGLGFGLIDFPTVYLEQAAFIVSFACAVLLYDVAFLIVATLFLRSRLAKTAGGKVEPPLRYFFSRFFAAFARVTAAALAAFVLFTVLAPIKGWELAGPSITFMMLVIGLAWSSRGFRIAQDIEKTTEVVSLLTRYKALPAGQLGSAVVFPILLGQLLTGLGLAETWIGPTVELILG